MFSQKNTIRSKTVISITDTEILYLTMKKNTHGFFVADHEKLPLVSGVVVNGEILMADVLYKKLRTITPKIRNIDIDLLLPHEYFLCVDIVLENDQKNNTLKKRVAQYLKKTQANHSWLATHTYEFSHYNVKNRDYVLLTCLPNSVYQSYHHILEKAGFFVKTINSNILSFDHILPKERTSLVYVNESGMQVAEFKNRIFISYKKFQASYRQFTLDIMKHLNIADSAARKILDQYGVLRAHKDEKVYKRLLRSLSPLLDFMSKRKIKDRSYIKILFSDIPIPGLVDVFKKRIHSEVHELDTLNIDTYTFQDVLSLHRKDSYQYQSHIAQALKAWQEK